VLSLKITVNGEARTTQAETLDDLCRELGFMEARIATARNGAFVTAKERGRVSLEDGDKIEILSPRQGG
jgi:sulfur carrier protein